MRMIFAVIAFLGAAASAFEFLTTTTSAASAPQQAAGAAMAIVYVVLPYCVFRVVSDLEAGKDQERIRNALELMNAAVFCGECGIANHARSGNCSACGAKIVLAASTGAKIG